jgi:hypothetical protein
MASVLLILRIWLSIKKRSNSIMRYIRTGRFNTRPVLCPKIFVPQQEFLIDRSGDVGHHPRPKHFGFPLDLHPSESEIVDAVFQPEKPIRGEPVESCKLRYFNSFEFFDHTGESPCKQNASNPVLETETLSA